MKYSVNVNQKQALALGITNINQAAILDLLCGAAAWATPQIIGEKVFYWVARQAISRELPLLDIKSDTVYRHFKTLADLGLIEYTKLGKKDCMRITDKGRAYYVGFDSEKSSEMNPTDQLIIKDINKKKDTCHFASEITPEKIVKAFNNKIKTAPKILKLSGKRRKAITTMSKEMLKSAAEWQLYFQKVNESDFLSGRLGVGQWRANADWLFNKNNALKVIEGNYDNHAGDAGDDWTEGLK